MKKTQISFRSIIHQKIINQKKEVDDWFAEKTKNKPLPFYSSFDIRDSHFKIACVDANLFPAGFNNICEEDQKRASSLIKNHLRAFYPFVKKIILLAEEHSRNFHYWDNILVIQSLIEQAGYSVVVCVPGKHITSAQKITTARGRTVSVQLLNSVKGDLIISNNDFSSQYDLPVIKINPPVAMGWLFRKKQDFFREYNLLAKEFSALLKIDPWHLTINTELFSPFDMESKSNLLKLKSRVAPFLQALKQDRESRKIEEEPYLFLKNSSGTYGLGIINVYNPEDLNQWSYKARKKMKSSKGETKTSAIIIQEGIPTALYGPENQSAEPVIYMVGCQVAGGFLRSHKTKDHKTNLNSPGAVFRRLCISDLEIKIQGLAMENVYSWLAKLGVLALSREMAHLPKLRF